MADGEADERRVCVIGAGVAGLITALRLIEQHPTWKIVVIEELEQEGGMTSFGPAGETLFENLPGSVTGLFKQIDLDTSLLFSSSFWGFGCRTAWASLTKGKQKKKDMKETRQEFLETLRKHPSLVPFCKKNGAMYVARSSSLFRKMSKDLSPAQQKLTREEAIAKEPALKNETFAGAVFSANDGFIFVQPFLREVAKVCKDKGVEFRFCTELITGRCTKQYVELETRSAQRLGHALKKRGPAVIEKFDQVVVCAGVLSQDCLERIGGRKMGSYLHGRQFPVKGYSLTGKASDINAVPAPKIACVFKQEVKFCREMVDDDLSAVDDGRYRIGGGSVWRPYLDYTIRPGHLKKFRDTTLGRSLLDNGDVEAWAGIRPVAFSQTFLVHALSNQRRVFVNTGYGANGYVWCWLAAKRLEEEMLRPPSSSCC